MREIRTGFKNPEIIFRPCVVPTIVVLTVLYAFATFSQRVTAMRLLLDNQNQICKTVGRGTRCDASQSLLSVPSHRRCFLGNWQGVHGRHPCASVCSNGQRIFCSYSQLMAAPAGVWFSKKIFEKLINF